MKLQSYIRALLESSSTTFGERLSQWLWAEEQFSIIDKFQCGWNDGGCNILADALIEYFGGAAERVAIFGSSDRGDRGQPQHVLVRVGGEYIDADGSQSARSLLDKMSELEGVENGVIRAYPEYTSDSIPTDKQASSELSQRIRAEFGDPA